MASEPSDQFLIFLIITVLAVPGLGGNIETSIFEILLMIRHGFSSFLLVGGGAKIGSSVFDMILVNLNGFPSFLIVWEGAKIGISIFDIILVLFASLGRRHNRNFDF